MANPMDQFKVETLVPLAVRGHDVSFTNSAVWMLAAVAAIALFLFVGTAEYVYEFISKMMDTNVGPEGRRFVPLVFSVFVFVLGCNLLGLIPWIGAFTPTAHISVTLGLAVIVFGTVCIVGFARHGLHFFSLFWPKGVNPVLGIFICLLEILSFLSRPFTLAIRLFANMTAGHVLLKVFGTFVVALGSFGMLPYVFGVVPLVADVALTALELLVAVVQAYVFALLASFYLNDAINLH
jgi:F-type H+-transporting ATPase subunit a